MPQLDKPNANDRVAKGEFKNYKLFWIELQAFLKDRGLCLVEMKLTPNTPIMPLPFPLRCLFFGRTRKGVLHCIVGEIRHGDLLPIWNPSDARIEGVDALGLICPLRPDEVLRNQTLTSQP